MSPCFAVDDILHGVPIYIYGQFSFNLWRRCALYRRMKYLQNYLISQFRFAIVFASRHAFRVTARVVVVARWSDTSFERQRLFKRPDFKSALHCCRRKTNTFCPLNQQSRFAVKGYEAISAHVASLFNVGCPTNIHRPAVLNALRAFTARIITIIILSINGVFKRRTVAFISQEVSKILPSLANYDPPPVIVRMVATSTNHVHPAIKRRAYNTITGVPMLGGCDYFSATAGFRVSALNARCQNDQGIPAFTETQPTRVTTIRRGVAFNGKPVELLISKIVCVGRGACGILPLRHLVSLSVDSWRHATGRANVAVASL